MNRILTYHWFYVRNIRSKLPRPHWCDTTGFARMVRLGVNLGGECFAFRWKPEQQGQPGQPEKPDEQEEPKERNQWNNVPEEPEEPENH